MPVSFTIGSFHDDALKFWEPNAPGFKERAEALKYAYDNGWETSVSCEPYLDSDIEHLVIRLLPFIVDTIWIGKMNMIPSRVKDPRVNNIDWTKGEPKERLDEVYRCQSDAVVWNLYNNLKNTEKVRWKDSIKKVIGLNEEAIG